MPSKNPMQMRRFIRHPTDIPIEIQCTTETGYEHQCTKDVGFGGLSFFSDTAIKKETVIALRIPYLRPAVVFPAARVAWCRKNGSKNTIGVQFLDSDEVFRVRMVEQICHVESYRRDVAQREGRLLTDEQAAEEWVSKYASSFPDP